MKSFGHEISQLTIRATPRGVIGISPRGGQCQERSGKTEDLLTQRWHTLAGEELQAYFLGRLSSFSTPCDLRELPEFTQAVLKIVRRIPYGEVRSYCWVAQRLGKPKASRAVGNALARNPVLIVIPCHRVVRKDGSLGGYALGLAWKKSLLALEGVRCAGERHR